MPDGNSARTVQFHYIKSKDFRLVMAEGVIGSITPSSKIVMSLFNERLAIPKHETYFLSEAGELQNLKEAEGKTGFVREVEFAVAMDRDAAEGLRDWLTERISELDGMENES